MGNKAKRNGNGGVSELPAETSTSSKDEIKRKPDGTFAKGQSGHPGNLWKKGQSGNPGGKPRLIRETYTEWLGEPNRQQPGKTNVRVGVEAVGAAFLTGDIQAAREIRSATEGTQLTVSYQNEIVQWLQQGLITVEEVQAELSAEEARTVLLAAGTTLPDIALNVVDAESEVVEE